ncbi:hypothetical protein ACMA1I_23130 [Pontibacter sp. 13R65]|uniref:hypothetical protein n=1 Tax=Pontibacter sp. 13R65 TaxID=3127458 RepID=UPI0039C99CCB
MTGSISQSRTSSSMLVRKALFMVLPTALPATGFQAVPGAPCSTTRFRGEGS